MMNSRPLFLAVEDASFLNLEDTPVSSPELFLAWQANHIAKRRLARVWHSDIHLVAEINHGRWIVVCPACTMGAYTHPEWKMACCAECGAVYEGVQFPSKSERSWIEALLLSRPRSNQNWFPTETFFDLKKENLQHGVA